MKIALAQLNTTVGDLAGNEAKILAAYALAIAAGADLLLTPELAITGYPPRDLLTKPHFVAQNLAALERLATQTGNAGPHAATHIGERTFHYDRNGNQSGWDDDTSGQRRRIAWDEENRIRSISPLRQDSCRLRLS